MWTQPLALFGLALIPILLILTVWPRRKRTAAIGYSSLTSIKALSLHWRHKVISRIPTILRALAIAFCVLAIAKWDDSRKQFKDPRLGIDIMLVVDTSASMQAIDFTLDGEPADRLSAVKHVISRFISDRPSDRFGVIIFGTDVFTQAPLTLDHELIRQMLDNVSIAMAGENTALGDALAVGVKRIKSIEAKTKVIILLTDGEQTAGRVDAVDAAEAAKEFGIRVYTIGVGKEGQVPMPVEMFGRRTIQWMESNIDEETLKKIAAATDGEFFRAYDTDSLRSIYETIDRLEKRKIEKKAHSISQAVDSRFVWLALLMVSFELLFQFTRWRRIP